ncbi:uncharacterized protein LOC143579705 [Bidens hawaiensis]|uniref:uncharacterized protein LOC143579705 n=1 Tax=Bidens hawaiensis TaxID=980011 RepID=UPI00404A1369
MDLYGPVNLKSISGELYCLAVTDDYSTFSWVMFLESKDKTFENLMALSKSWISCTICRSEEFEAIMEPSLRKTSCINIAMSMVFFMILAHLTLPNKMGSLNERIELLLKQQELCFMIQSYMLDFGLRSLERLFFELVNRRKPNLRWLETFGSQRTVLEHNGKFGAKPVEGFFMGYDGPLGRVFLPSINHIVEVQNVGYQIYNIPTHKPGDAWMFDYENLWKYSAPEISPFIVEPVHQESFFEESPIDTLLTPSFDHDGEDHEDVIESLGQSSTPSSGEVNAEENVTNLPQDVIVSADSVPGTLSYHPEDNIIGELHTKNRFSFKCFITQTGPKTFKEALTEESWVNTMQEEFQEFKKLGVWKLVDLRDDKKGINTKWVFKCKCDENGIIDINKVRLVVLGFNQREGIDCNEVYAL